ncbi:Uncharacterised protein [Klebsiella pneumoniae]|nr:Uncharacterised protein [Klebsiella pneumoniae]
MTGCQCRIEGDAPDALQTRGQQFVSAILYHFGDVGIRRAAVRRVVLNTAIFRRVMRRRDHDAVCQRTTFFVVHQDGIGNGRRRGETVVFLHDNINAVGRQHFQYGNKGRFGERVGIFTHVAGTGNPVPGAVFRNRLRDRQNMLLIEVMAPCTATMARGTKLHRMLRVARFRPQYVVLRGQLSDVNQITLLCRLPCAFTVRHFSLLSYPSGLFMCCCRVAHRRGRSPATRPGVSWLSVRAQSCVLSIYQIFCAYSRTVRSDEK